MIVGMFVFGMCVGMAIATFLWRKEPRAASRDYNDSVATIRADYEKAADSLRKTVSSVRAIRVVAAQVPGGIGIVSVPVGPTAIVRWTQLCQTIAAMEAVPEGDGFFMHGEAGGLAVPAEDLPAIRDELTKVYRAYVRATPGQAPS